MAGPSRCSRLRSGSADRPGARAAAAVEKRGAIVLLGLRGGGGIAGAADRGPGAVVELVLAPVGAVRRDGGGVPARLAGGDRIERRRSRRRLTRAKGKPPAARRVARSRAPWRARPGDERSGPTCGSDGTACEYGRGRRRGRHAARAALLGGGLGRRACRLRARRRASARAAAVAMSLRFARTRMNHLQFDSKPGAITAWPRAAAKARVRGLRRALRFAGRPSPLGGLEERADRRRAP